MCKFAICFFFVTLFVTFFFFLFITLFILCNFCFFSVCVLLAIKKKKKKKIPNVCLWRRSYGDVVGRHWPWKTVTVSSHLHMPVRPTLLHRMVLVSFLLFLKNLGNLREFFRQMVYRPPPPPGKKLPVRLCVWDGLSVWWFASDR